MEFCFSAYVKGGIRRTKNALTPLKTVSLQVFVTPSFDLRQYSNIFVRGIKEITINYTRGETK